MEWWYCLGVNSKHMLSQPSLSLISNIYAKVGGVDSRCLDKDFDFVDVNIVVACIRWLRYLLGRKSA